MTAACRESFNLDYRRYRRPFRKPLLAGARRWEVREGILVRVAGRDGASGYGEAAPVEAFGTEGIEEAERFLRDNAGPCDASLSETVPETHPCCRFALESAFRELETRAVSPGGGSGTLPVAGLLPAGEAALGEARRLYRIGYRTFKWKVGVYKFEEEREWFRQLREACPEGVGWRLDANGAFDVRLAVRWANEADASVEYLEQPLAPENKADLLALASDISVPLALDESVGTLRCLREWHDRGWPGIFVVKPALAGSPSALAAFVREARLPVVFSSALETGVGMKAALRTAFGSGRTSRAVGWGTGGVFPDDGLSPDAGPGVALFRINLWDTDAVWEAVAQ